jgi:hypothetical protein
MVFNPWIEKGRQFYRHAEAVPDVTILNSLFGWNANTEKRPASKLQGSFLSTTSCWL